MGQMMKRLRGLLVRKLWSREPNLRCGGNSIVDWLPPVLAPADWSCGLIQSLADSSTAWYFDRQ